MRSIYLLLMFGLSFGSVCAQSTSGPLASAPLEPVPTRSHLRVVFKGIRNEKGWLGMLLFNGENGYPADYKKAFRLAYTRISGDEVALHFKDVPFGQYAIVMLHDENANMNMDFNFLGIPKEGYGASNNAARYFGPPRYRDAKFTVDRAEQVVEINPIYW